MRSGLAIGLAVVPREHLRPLLAVTIVLGLLLWVATQGFGLILTGAATDPNSGPLVVLMALACWPILRARGLEQAHIAAPGASCRAGSPA